MAKKIYKPRKHDTGRLVTTKTAFGITSDMVVNDVEVLSKVTIADGMILVKDDAGYFVVPKNRVDDGMACPLRYCEEYRDEMDDQFAEILAIEKE